MIGYSIIGAALVAGTVIVHALGTVLLIRLLAPHKTGQTAAPTWQRASKVLIGTVMLLLVLHLIEIVVWAVAYLLLDPGSDLPTFGDAIYFSLVTYTTLGYGDITLSGPWRVMSGIEALNGMLLAGWSTATLFVVVQKVMQAYRLQPGDSP